jgi:amino acid transporter
MDISKWGIAAGLYAYPGMDFNVMIALTAFLCVFWGATVGLFAVVMPRSGGDYAYVSRTLHPAIGFANNFAFTILALFTFWGLGGTTYGAVQFGLSSYLDAVGRITANSSIVSFGQQVQSGWLAFIISTIFVLISVGLSLGPKRITRLAIKILFLCGMLVYVAPLIAFATTSHVQYVELFNAFGSKYYGTTYQGIIDLAKSKGWTPYSYSLQNTVLALPVGLLGFFGFTNVSYAGGEVKRGGRRILYAIMLSLGFGLVMSVITWTLMRNVVGTDFMAAASYLANTGNSPLPAYSSTPMFFSVPVYPDPVVTSLTFLSYFIQVALFFGVSIAVVSSRNIFAWSYDRLMPKWFCNVSDRFHAPTNALLITTIMAELTVAVFAIAPWITIDFNVLAVVFFSQIIVGLSAALFPCVRKDLFASAPPLAKKTMLGVPLLTVCGTITMLVMAIAGIVDLASPMTSGPISPIALTFSFGLYAIAIVWYYVAKWCRARDGIDLSLAFKEIPPE